MKKVKGQPITGTNTQMKASRPVLTDAADTSADAQKLVNQAPYPFKNPTSQANQPPSGAASGGISTLEPKIQSGLKHSNPGAKSLPSGGAIGQNKMPNQKPQIGGRMGFPPPARKAGVNGQGFPSKRNARFYGE